MTCIQKPSDIECGQLGEFGGEPTPRNRHGHCELTPHFRSLCATHEGPFISSFSETPNPHHSSRISDFTPDLHLTAAPGYWDTVPPPPQRGQVTCPRSHSCYTAEVRSELCALCIFSPTAAAPGRGQDGAWPIESCVRISSPLLGLRQMASPLCACRATDRSSWHWPSG